MKIYISGPISGYENGNREAFLLRAKLLVEAGHTPVNPHDCSPEHVGDCLGRELEGKPHRYGCYLRGDLRELLDCDAITFLSGWMGSPGAAVERVVALAVGLRVVTLGIDY